MFAVCLRYADNQDEAKDLLHDAFIKMFQKIKVFEEQSRFEAWMHRLFTNHCIDYLRSAYKKKFNNRLPIENDFHIEEEIEENTEFDPLAYSPEELILAIQKLPHDFRLVLNLYAIENKSHQEIAEIMNIEPATSRSKLMRARKALKKHIVKWIPNEKEN